MNLKKMYNIVICGMLVLLIVTMALFVNFHSLVSYSRDLNQDGMKLITLSNDMLHVNNYLVKLMRLFVVNNDTSILDEYDSILNDYESLSGKLDKMVEIGLTDSEEKQLDELLALLDQLAEIEGRALDAFNNGDSEEAASIIHGDEYSSTDALLASKTTALISDITNRADTTASDIQGKIETRMIFLIVFISVSIFCLIALQILQKNRVLKPIGEIQNITERVSRGDIDIHVERKQNDEIGLLLERINDMVRSISEQCRVVERVASGDLTVDIAARSDKDAMNFALIKMVDDLNNTFSEIAGSTAQVNMGATQLAGGAQTLAQGASEQASAIEELSKSVSQMTARTKENADMAAKAEALAGTIKDSAEKGAAQMDRMVQAVREIHNASQSIGKVMKVIDDIAFQTNILALNAAVEAARAGQHGKGFAVVAEEVRNLAAKSAEAAKDTGSLIANSMEKAELGARIAEETAESLAGIVSGIGESSIIIGDIAKSSEFQNTAIAEINNGIHQVENIVHQNSAATEESAAASEEMSGQADVLNELVTQFKLKNNTNSRRLSARPDLKDIPLALDPATAHKY